MTIRKSYERIVNLGNFENVKVGVELTMNSNVTKAEDVKKQSISLGKLAKQIVDEELLNVTK